MFFEKYLFWIVVFLLCMFLYFESLELETANLECFFKDYSGHTAKA